MKETDKLGEGAQGSSGYNVRVRVNEGGGETWVKVKSSKTIAVETLTMDVLAVPFEVLDGIEHWMGSNKALDGVEQDVRQGRTRCCKSLNGAKVRSCGCAG